MEYVQGRNNITMSEVVSNAPRRFRFLEGMVSKEIISLQLQYVALSGSRLSIEKQILGLITRLLEIPHGQWIHRKFMVHDLVAGIIATAKKEELLVNIEQQRELGDEGLLEEDKYLGEVNREDLACTSGERHISGYWPYKQRRK